MKLVVSVILFLTAGPFIEAHNVRVGSQQVVKGRDEGLLAIGSPCDVNADCESGICNFDGFSDMCVECMSNMDCMSNPASAGDMCNIHDPDIPPYCTPRFAYGSPCHASEDCESNLCVYSASMAAYQCVECTSNMDCMTNPIGPVCNTQDSAVPPYCAPLFMNGSACNDDEDCESNICAFDDVNMVNVCVECTSNMDCMTNPIGPVCNTQDSAVPPYCAPTYAIGSQCQMGEDCESNICVFDPISAYNVCVGCQSNMDCMGDPLNTVCYMHDPAMPAFCGPLLPSGSSCHAAEDCESYNCQFDGAAAAYICA